MKAISAAILFAAALAAPTVAVAQAHVDASEAIAQAYEPDPAVWLLQDEDTKIYLFGTVHVLPEGFRWRSARLDRIVAEAEELVIESSDDEVVGADPRIARAMGSVAKRPRVSERLSPERLQCIGTSATMASEGTARNKQEVVANVASKLFSTAVDPSHVIIEELERVTDKSKRAESVKSALGPAIDAGIPSNITDDALRNHALAVWTETRLGITTTDANPAWHRASPASRCLPFPPRPHAPESPT